MYVTISIDDGIFLLFLLWLTFMLGIKLAKGTFLEQRINKKLGIAISTASILVLVALIVV
jgi:hypothetical protein